MLRHRLFVSLVCAALALTVVAGAQEAKAPDFAAVEKAVRAELTASNTPGAAVAVVLDGRVVYARGFGVANVETGDAMRPEMLFRLGSTTKMITAATVVLLAEQGKLSLTEPIGRYIPNLHPSLARLTAHQLLSHQSGILDEAPMFGSHDDTAMKAEIAGWTDTKFFAEPGEVYSYSNPAYWLAGLLAESVGGRPFADQVAETIFAPLGMTRSTFRPTIAMTYPLAQGHEIADGKPRIIRPAADNSASWPAGSIYSNVMDLSRWMMAVVDSGQLGGAAALPAGVFEVMTTPRAEIPGLANRYGYGVQVGDWRGVPVIEHGGSRSGYGSVMRMFPAQKAGVIVLANRTGASLSETANAASVAILGGAVGRDALTFSAHDGTPTAPDVAGTYWQGGTRKLVVERRGGTLVLLQGTRATPLEAVTQLAQPPNPREFLMTAGGTRYVFILDEGGKVRFLHSGGRSWRKVQ